MRIEEFLINKTEEILLMIYADDNIIIFENFNNQEGFELKYEYITQILIIHHNQNCDCSYYNKIKSIFNFNLNSFQICCPDETWEKEKLLLYKKFKKWLHLILLFQHEELNFDLSLCQKIGQIFQKIISMFLFLEDEKEKNKTFFKPKNSPPFQTFMVNFLFLKKNL